MNQTRTDAVSQAIESHADRPGALLPVLHAIQDRIGYIPPEAVPVVAKALNLSRAEVHGVISFYHDFRLEPPGRHVVRICLAEACQAMGGTQLRNHARSVLGVDLRSITPDGAIGLEPVYCLGNCACAPSIMIDGELHGRVSTERFDDLVADLRERP